MNTFGKSVAHDLLMFHVGMNLDLVDDRLDTSVCQQFVHMMRIEVAHPDGTDLPHIDILSMILHLSLTFLATDQ